VPFPRYKNRTIFLPPRVFCAQLKGFPWNWVPALGVIKLEWRGYGAEKEVWRYLSLVDTTHQRDRQTDGQTDTERQKRPRLCIASRSKNYMLLTLSPCVLIRKYLQVGGLDSRSWPRGSGLGLGVLASFNITVKNCCRITLQVLRHRGRKTCVKNGR